MENDGEERNRERANRERNLRENEQCRKSGEALSKEFWIREGVWKEWSQQLGRRF